MSSKTVALIGATVVVAGGGYYLVRRATGLEQLKANITVMYRVLPGFSRIRITDITITNQSRGRITIKTPQIRIFSDQQALDNNEPLAASKIRQSQSYELAPRSTVSLPDIEIPLRIMNVLQEINSDISSGRIAVLVQTLVPVSLLGLHEVISTVEAEELRLSGFLGGMESQHWGTKPEPVYLNQPRFTQPVVVW